MKYPLCICSVIVGELQAFRNYKGFSVISLEFFDAIKHFTKGKIFPIPLSITFLYPKIYPTKALRENMKD